MEPQMGRGAVAVVVSESDQLDVAVAVPVESELGGDPKLLRKQLLRAVQLLRYNYGPCCYERYPNRTPASARAVRLSPVHGPVRETSQEIEFWRAFYLRSLLRIVQRFANSAE